MSEVDQILARISSLNDHQLVEIHQHVEEISHQRLLSTLCNKFEQELNAKHPRSRIIVNVIDYSEFLQPGNANETCSLNVQIDNHEALAVTIERHGAHHVVQTDLFELQDEQISKVGIRTALENLAPGIKLEKYFPQSWPDEQIVDFLNDIANCCLRHGQ
jgi:hypothetical protein